MRTISELIDQERIVEKGPGTVLLKGGPGQKSRPKGQEWQGSRAAGPSFPLQNCRVHLLALGDVGGTVLLGLRLLGGLPPAGPAGGKPLIERIGIFDLDPRQMRRYEREINQIRFPDGRQLPRVDILEEQDLFDCDVFVFCASKGVPPVGSGGDVRMAQLEANRQLIGLYGKKAAAAGFTGLFAVVSDPVDPLCKAAVLAGLDAFQVQGYGLGVMNARAAYFAQRQPEFASYLTEGRVFGPHGADLVVADSLAHYDDRLSRELTRLTINSNMETRADGFKPYLAPAISSGAIAITETLAGRWNDSSVYLGAKGRGAFLGCRNRRQGRDILLEDRPMPEALFARIRQAYENLEALGL